MKKNSLSKELSLSADSGIEPNFTKSNSAQSGRSMIEMLGVLAIIGVLSVGGIAGYSKAMMKFKINKTADQISTIVTNTRTLFSSQKKYTGLNATIAKKAHLIPDEMITGTGSDWNSFENAFGGKIQLSARNKTTNYGGGDDKAFMVIFYDIPEEACIELATMDWGSGSSSGLISVSAGKNSSEPYNAPDGCPHGSNETAVSCVGNSDYPVPMPVSNAAQYCTGNNNIIALKYY